MERKQFRDAVALVTGSSRGIGNAIARKLAASGMDIVINYRKAGGSSEEQGNKLLLDIRKMGQRAILIRADISRRDDVRRLIGETVEKLGRLDFLILNAATTFFKPIERLFEREIRKLVECNFIGNIFCIQAALPLLESAGGKIIFISSIGSRLSLSSYPLGSMKSAMETVVRDCAENLRDRRIAVNGVCAGIVRTASFKVFRYFNEEIEMIPEGFIVEPDEIAEVVLFLCSPASRGILGQTIVIDKGLSNSAGLTAGRKNKPRPAERGAPMYGRCRGETREDT